LLTTDAHTTHAALSLSHAELPRRRPLVRCQLQQPAWHGSRRSPVIRRLPRSFLYIIPTDPDVPVTAASDEVISISTALSVNVLSKLQ